MNALPRLLIATAAAALLGIAAAPGALAEEAVDPTAPRGVTSDPAAFAGVASRVRFDQRPGSQLPMNATFVDESGREAPLSAHFGRRPAVVALIFHRCPLLCSQVLSALTRSLKPLPLTAGVDFDVLAVSIDPEDTPESSRKKKEGYLAIYDRPGAEEGWKFLTGEKDAIDALCGSLGFRYVQDPATKQFAHAAGIVITTPDGRASRYFFGIDFPPKEVDAAIRKAGEGQVGSKVAALLLLCYDYDAATGKYTLSIVRLLRAAATLTALSLGLFLFLMFRRERRGRIGDGTPGAVAPDTAVDGLRT